MLPPVVNTLIVDIRDMNPDIYRDYAGQSNAPVLDNLRLIVELEKRTANNTISITMTIAPLYSHTPYARL